MKYNTVTLSKLSDKSLEFNIRRDTRDRVETPTVPTAVYFNYPETKSDREAIIALYEHNSAEIQEEIARLEAEDRKLRKALRNALEEL